MHAVQVSYVEIYNEAIKDLLVGSSAAAAGAAQAGKAGGKAGSVLEVREKPSGEVYIDGAIEAAAANVREVAVLLEAGNSSRAVGSHK